MLQEDPRHVQALINSASLWGQRGEIEKSIKLLKKAVQIAPDDPIAHVNLAISFRAAGQIDAAIEHLQRSTALDPENRRTQELLRKMTSRRSSQE